MRRLALFVALFLMLSLSACNSSSVTDVVSDTSLSYNVSSQFIINESSDEFNSSEIESGDNSGSSEITSSEEIVSNNSGTENTDKEEKTMKILFVGNSYTYYNDMPAMLRTLATDNGKKVLVDSVTKGGRKLYENLSTSDENYKKICSLADSNEYDVLILQEHSRFSLSNYADYENAVLKLIEIVGAKRNILYCTWGLHTGNPGLTENGWTNVQMTELLYNTVKKAAEKSGAEISPVGLCFDEILKIDANADLYNGDEFSHPSYMGSCVVALTHYRKIFGENPSDISSLNLDKQTLQMICDIVKVTN